MNYHSRSQECHPEPRRRRGTSQLEIQSPDLRQAKLTKTAWRKAVAIERLRGPSARVASLGMTTLWFEIWHQN
jgi:hypothetical protein